MVAEARWRSFSRHYSPSHGRLVWPPLLSQPRPACMLVITLSWPASMPAIILCHDRLVCPPLLFQSWPACMPSLASPYKRAAWSLKVSWWVLLWIALAFRKFFDEFRFRAYNRAQKLPCCLNRTGSPSNRIWFLMSHHEKCKGLSHIQRKHVCLGPPCNIY